MKPIAFAAIFLSVCFSPSIATIIRASGGHRRLDHVTSTPILFSAGSMSSESDAVADCDIQLEIMLVQDISTSYEDDVKSIYALLPALFDFFEKEYNSRVRFGISTFVDKPLGSFGSLNDECAYLEMPLTPVGNPGTLSRARNVVRNLIIAGGKDWIEGMNEGLIRTALSSKVGWSEHSHDPVTGLPVVRVMILATDAAVHIAEYHANTTGIKLPANNLLEKPHLLDKDMNYGCAEMDYPTPQQLKSALATRGIIPVILAAKPYFVADTGAGQLKILFSEWVNFLKHLDMYRLPYTDPDKGLAAYYEDFLENQMQVDGVVELIDAESSEFVLAMKRAIQQVIRIVCIVTTTTTTSNTTSTEIVTKHSTTPPPITSTAAFYGTTNAPSTATPPSTTFFTWKTNISECDGTPVAMILGAASGVAAALALLGAGATKLFMSVGYHPPLATAADTTHANEADEFPNDREQFEVITGDHFC